MSGPYLEIVIIGVTRARQTFNSRPWPPESPTQKQKARGGAAGLIVFAFVADQAIALMAAASRLF